MDIRASFRLFRCLIEIYECQMSNECMEAYGSDQVRRGITVSSQLIYLSTVSSFGCSSKFNQFIRDRRDQKALTLHDLISEQCANFYEETAKFRKDRKKLARVGSPTVQLIMEQSRL